MNNNVACNAILYITIAPFYPREMCTEEFRPETGRQWSSSGISENYLLKRAIKRPSSTDVIHIY